MECDVYNRPALGCTGEQKKDTVLYIIQCMHILICKERERKRAQLVQLAQLVIDTCRERERERRWVWVWVWGGGGVGVTTSVTCCLFDSQ